jgi:tetratricopeptide (TPR) repeat protein
MEEEDWISPIYCWLLNRLNDVREMETFVCNYNGNNPQISFEISKYYYLNGEYDKALEILKGFQKESETPELFMLYALIYANIQENNDAIKSAEKCIELDDSFADAYILLASLTKREDAKKAVSFLRKAKDLDAENPNIYYELSAISEFNDDFLLSAKYLKDYINLSGDEDIRVLIKLTVFLNYANDKKWEVEYFDVVRRIQNKSKIENITIPIIIVPKHMELGAFYCFHCDGDKCCLEKNGNIISDVIDLKFIFGIGTYTSPTNNWLIKFDNNTFSNPARLVDESIDSSALSPAIFCFPKSYEAYNKILQELLATETFVVNHNYSENSKEYHDSKRLINLKIEEKNRNVYGVLKIMDKLKYSFTIYDVSEGYKGFCDTINKSPFEEAMFIISMNDKIHQNIFVFKTDQIEVKQ